MQVLPQCGHAVHEDAPDKVSLVPGDIRGQLGGMWVPQKAGEACVVGFICYLPAPQVPSWRVPVALTFCSEELLVPFISSHSLVAKIFATPKAKLHPKFHLHSD